MLEILSGNENKMYLNIDGSKKSMEADEDLDRANEENVCSAL